MLSSVRYFLSDLRHWLFERRWRLLLVPAALLAIAAATAGVVVLVGSDDDGEGPAPAPEAIVSRVAESDEAQDLGFPGFATKNTTRVAGADAAADAAGVALAVYPATGGTPSPAAVTLVDADQWYAGVAAASLVAAPIGAPLLVSEGGEFSRLTVSALATLRPSGSSATDDRQVFRIGDAAEPGELRSLDVTGANPAELAERIERLRSRLVGGEPDHILLASADEPAFAMPAAGWAARSGDPILFVQRESVPAPTRAALERHEGVPVYVLGPESVISAAAFGQIKELAPNAKRIAGQDPVANAIAFARYADGTFGWNINDPGHGLVIANASRPLDAGAAAPLSASGTWGPLLVTDDAAALPAAMRGYLLDLKPGYEEDPTRAVYNHVWLIGDDEAISVDFQAQVDELTELAPVRSGSGPPALAPPPGAAEQERDRDGGRRR